MTVLVFDFIARALAAFLLVELAWFLSRVLAAVIWRNDA